jgi:glycosyltransferase involved in cell wall biosynthesis
MASCKGASRCSVVILTRNEEINLPTALDSVVGWADQVFIVDSESNDRTVEIAQDRGCVVVSNRFQNYSNQRNFAISNLPFATEWVLFLDADEWLPNELKQEIEETMASNPVENGFFLCFKLIWMGQWVRRGVYPCWVLRLFRRGCARCEDRAVNEHLIVEGAVGHLKTPFIHEDQKGLGEWIDKHNGYATREAAELSRKSGQADYREIEVRFWGSQAERKRWLRYRIWNRMPPLFRPLGYFCYRYFLLGGFLDGKRAAVFHFFHALWYPLLIDCKYIEMKSRRGKNSQVPGFRCR